MPSTPLRTTLNHAQEYPSLNLLLTLLLACTADTPKPQPQAPGQSPPIVAPAEPGQLEVILDPERRFSAVCSAMRTTSFIWQAGRRACGQAGAPRITVEFL